MLRRIEPLKSLVRLVPNEIDSALPKIEWVKPTDLYVNDEYQRDISNSSITMIRAIISQWNWGHFKPPIVAYNKQGLMEILDGQHTAISAASHPKITLIPVVVVDAKTIEEMAASFVQQNKMRVGITGMQIFHANCAAGDKHANAVKRICDLHGVNLLRVPPSNGEFKVNDTLAVATLLASVRVRGDEATSLMMGMVARPKVFEPIGASLLKAMDWILFNARALDEDAKFKTTAEDLEFALSTEDYLAINDKAEQSRKLEKDANKTKEEGAKKEKVEPKWQKIALVYLAAACKRTAAKKKIAA